MGGHATQHVAGLLRLYIVVGCQALLRMSPKANTPRGSAAAEGALRLMQDRWRTCSTINNSQTNVWPTGLRSRWCPPFRSPCRSYPSKSRQCSRCRLVWRCERAAGQCRSPGSRSSGPLDRGAAVGVDDVTAGDANHQAPATGLEHNTQEALGTSHALSSPKDQATRLRVPPS